MEGQETEQGTTVEGGATETASEVATTVTEMTPGDEVRTTSKLYDPRYK